MKHRPLPYLRCAAILLLLMILPGAVRSAAVSGDVRAPSPGARLTPLGRRRLLPQACSGQSLISIDPVRNMAYVAIYSLDRSGNAQLAVVDLAAGAARPVLKTISLIGSVQPVAVAYNPGNRTMLAEARDVRESVSVYEINTITQSVANRVRVTGLTHWGMAGGIVEDFKTNRAVVAGTMTVGILDTSQSPPIWLPRSAIGLAMRTDSMALNVNTGLMFISSLGDNLIVDTDLSPLRARYFVSDPNGSVSSGVAFDIGTNLLIQAQENGSDSSYVFNGATLDTNSRLVSAESIYVPGLGVTPPVGRGPGGQAIVNCATHQAVIADDCGHNFKLIQLPAAPLSGVLNNHGQPGSGTQRDAGSAYTVAAATIPKGNIKGAPAQLVIIDDPSSLAIDPLHNFLYMLADANPKLHQWIIGSPTPLFLVREDLSRPVFGASATGGINGKTFWLPSAAAIRLP
jgi:hypothetical protein